MFFQHHDDHAPLVRCWCCSLLLLLLLAAASSVQGIRILPSEAEHRRRTNALHDNNNNNATTRTTKENVPVDVPTDPSGHLVTSLPLLDSTSALPTQHWAGHLPASKDGDKYFFYWLFAPDFSDSPGVSEADNVPLIVWLNGGPACSSMDGLFIENGPFRLQTGSSESDNNAFRVVCDPDSWHRRVPAYVVYVDQPVGTGLSFTTSGKYPRNDAEVNTDFYHFLQQFFTLHADKFVDASGGGGKVTRRLFFAGESYAGHYIPSLMNYLLKQNENNKSSDDNSNLIEIPVAGGAIGNGWTDPYYQYAGAEFAYGEGLIGKPEVAKFSAREQDCQRQLNAGRYSVGVCFDLIDDILHESHGGTSDTKASGYDVRQSESKHGSRAFPPGHKVVETYLGGWALPKDEDGVLDESGYQQVLQAIHASAATEAGQRYRECTDPPYNALAGNDGRGVVDDVVAILEHPDKVELLFFNGIHDIICNHVGNERFLMHLPWEHTEKWTLARRYAWFAKNGKPGKVSGYMQEYENLKFLKVMDAGHMVPMDVPAVAAEMMKLFVYGGSFESSPQALDKSTDDKSCPICPTCLERDSGASRTASNDHNPVDVDRPTSDGSGAMGQLVISAAWIAAGFGVVVFLVGVVLARRNNNSRSARAQMVPTYDIELRDGFRDAPISTNGNQMEENRVV